jgi:surfactin synthase thioesterase subunit
MMLTQIRKSIETTYNINFSVKDFWQYPTIKQFADFLQGLQGGENNSKSQAKPVLNQSAWFDKPTLRPEASLKLFCFHHAGGSASMYYPWANMLPDFVELVAVQLPGRAERMAEPHYQSMDALIQDLVQVITPELDRPFAFFGHSMGCLVAFALTRELRRQGKPLPTQLFLSASAYFPTFKGEKLHTRTDAELLGLFPDFSVENFGGDQEYFNIVFQALRADLAVVGSFQHPQDEPLDLPITVFGGEQDIVAPPKEMEGWENETTQHYEMTIRSGGHDYVSHDMAFLTQYITEKLSLYANSLNLSIHQ